jgi:hypothetical protein
MKIEICSHIKEYYKCFKWIMDVLPRKWKFATIECQISSCKLCFKWYHELSASYYKPKLHIHCMLQGQRINYLAKTWARCRQMRPPSCDHPLLVVLKIWTSSEWVHQFTVSATITRPIPKISSKSSDTIDGAWSHQLVALVKCVLLRNQ